MFGVGLLKVCDRWCIGLLLLLLLDHVVGPCHHGMACPQVADRGTASDKEGSCE